VWLFGVLVCLLAAPWVQLSVSAGNGWPHNVLRHHWLMSISCHFRDCKALLVTSLTHVAISSAITSVQTCTFVSLSTRNDLNTRYYRRLSATVRSVWKYKTVTSRKWSSWWVSSTTKSRSASTCCTQWWKWRGSIDHCDVTRRSSWSTSCDHSHESQPTSLIIGLPGTHCST